jgi:hypothetical protein
MCALLLCAVAAQGASAAGQTIFECSKSATTKAFSDAHCDTANASGEYGTVAFPGGAIKLTNKATKNATTEATIATLKIAELHGVANVVVECTEVSGTGEAANSETGGVMTGSGSGTIEFHSGGGGNCTTNQTGCTVKVAAVGAKAESIQPSASEMGLKFSATGTNFTTTTFEGTCSLHLFNAIPVKGSTIATANGEANGHGATAWFIEGSMNSLTVGGEPAQLIGKATLSSSATGNALVLST